MFFKTTAFAQETTFEERTTAFSSERSGGIGMHTNGFHAFFRYGKYLTGFTKRVYEIEVGNIKHPKEIRSVNPLEDNLRGYIFGKKNPLYVIRPTIGFHKEFVPKQSLKGVSITYVTQFGPSLGLVKPVYLNIERMDNAGTRIIVREKYDPEVHDQGQIYGRASFLNGFEEIKLYPGAFVKAGLQFDYGVAQEDLRALEVGLMADLYAKKVPIMAFTSNRQFYLNLYVSYMFGSRDLR